LLSLRLVRVTSHPKHGTFGTLTLGGRPICLTLEPYYNDNNPNTSCIPTGNYVCRRVRSQTHGETYEVTDVANRSYILFHKGNRDINSRGCILLGEEYGSLMGDWAILGSRKAHDEFMRRTKDERFFFLTITECF